MKIVGCEGSMKRDPRYPPLVVLRSPSGGQFPSPVRGAGNCHFLAGGSSRRLSKFPPIYGDTVYVAAVVTKGISPRIHPTQQVIMQTFPLFVAKLNRRQICELRVPIISFRKQG
jgi:hypothetical protein